MHYLRKVPEKNREDAVSPVVGVMLMLVVTIIIAAVVSGFSGGLSKGSRDSPDLVLDVHVINTGSYLGSGFYATVLGSSEAISTGDLKIVTTWSTTDKDPKSSTYGAVIHGGNTSAGGVSNVNYNTGFGSSSLVYCPAPFGYGTGAGAAAAQNPTRPEGEPNQYFGNYSLIQGTTMKAYPAGMVAGYQIGSDTYTQINSNGGYGSTGTAVGLYNYTPGSRYKTGQIDPAQAVLGGDWENLRAGDTVNVKVVYVPTSQVIFQKAVSVTEG